MERQSRDRLRVLSGQLAKGPEREVSKELAEKGDGHVALLEAEVGLMAGVANETQTGGKAAAGTGRLHRRRNQRRPSRL
jgi:hypothetical protein